MKIISFDFTLDRPV